MQRLRKAAGEGEEGDLAFRDEMLEVKMSY